MRRWLALGAVGLAVAWGPYLYSELARRPAEAPAPMRIETASLFDDAPPPMAATEHFESRTAAATEPDEPRPVAVTPVAAVIRPALPELPDPTPEGQSPAANADPPADPTGLPLELVPAFRSEFETQPRDSFWAAEEEPRLTQHIQAVGVPEGVVSEVSCRKTVCRAVFASLDLDKEIELKLYARLRENYGNKLTLDVRELEGGGRAALYVLRPGYKLEAPTQLAADRR